MLTGIPQLLADLSVEEARNVMVVEIQPPGVRLKASAVFVAPSPRICCVSPSLFLCFLNRASNIALSLNACCCHFLPLAKVKPYGVLRSPALGDSKWRS